MKSGASWYAPCVAGAFRFRVRSSLPVDEGAIDWTKDFVYRDGTLVTTYEADGDVLKPILNLRGDPRAHLDATGAVIANGGYYLGPFETQYSPTPESVDPGADPVKALHRSPERLRANEGLLRQ